MTIPQLYRRAALAISALLLFLLFFILFIPARVILNTTNRALSGQGLVLTATSFGKAFPLGLQGSGWDISSEKGKLLSLETASLKIELLPLLRGNVRLAIAATVAGGTLSGKVSLHGTPAFTMNLHNIQLEQVPFFTSVAGAQVAGILNAKADVSGSGSKSEGFLQLEAAGADLKGIKLGETPLPDASYRTIQGMLRIKDGIARLESFALQGEGIYVRLKGSLPMSSPLPSAPLDLGLELMPKPDFLERQKFVFLILAKYLDSPGHYQIPIKGTLGKPLVQ